MAKPELAPVAPEPEPVKMYMLTEQELHNLTAYVVKHSRHDLSGEEYLAVLGAVQEAHKRPVTKD